MRGKPDDELASTVRSTALPRPVDLPTQDVESIGVVWCEAGERHSMPNQAQSISIMPKRDALRTESRHRRLDIYRTAPNAPRCDDSQPRITRHRGMRIDAGWCAFQTSYSPDAR